MQPGLICVAEIDSRHRTSNPPRHRPLLHPRLPPPKRRPLPNCRRGRPRPDYLRRPRPRMGRPPHRSQQSEIPRPPHCRRLLVRPPQNHEAFPRRYPPSQHATHTTAENTGAASLGHLCLNRSADISVSYWGKLRDRPPRFQLRARNLRHRLPPLSLRSPDSPPQTSRRRLGSPPLCSSDPAVGLTRPFKSPATPPPATGFS